MDPMTIGALVSMIAGAGIQHHTQQQALKKQQRLALESQQRQLQARNAATDAAARKASEFDPRERKNAQQDIEQDLTEQYSSEASKPQITAQGVEVGTTIPGGTRDYMVARAREAAKTKASLHALASLMGRIGSAGELRQREAVAFGDTVGEIRRIKSDAERMFEIDQAGINAVTPNPVAMLAGQALSLYGGSRLATSGPGGGSTGSYALVPSDANPVGLQPDAPKGLGLRQGTGAPGLKLNRSWLSPA